MGPTSSLHHGPVRCRFIFIARHYLGGPPCAHLIKGAVYTVYYTAPLGVRMAGHLRAMLAATDDAPAKGPWTQHTLRMTMSGGGSTSR